MGIHSFAGPFFEITDVVPFCPNLRFCFLHVSTMLGLDDLNVVLFEFLDDHTKLAQSCTDWLYVAALPHRRRSGR